VKLTKSKLKEIIREEIWKLNEASREIGGYYLMKQLKDLAQDAKRNRERDVHKALMYLHDRINQSYRDIDLNVRDVQDIFNDPRGRKHGKNLPDWMVDSLFEGKINELTNKPRKGDHVKSSVHGEVGVIEKMRGKIVYVKYPGDRKSAWPSDIRTLKQALPSFVRGKLTNLWIEEGKVVESDLPITTKKGKTVTVVHKRSGKELVITDKPHIRRQYKRMGYLVSERKINEVNAREIRKKLLKKFGKDPLYREFILAKTPKEQKKAVDTLKSIRGPNAIRLMQKYANSLQRESINEGIFSDYHKLNRAYMDDFIKNYKKLNRKNVVKKKGDDVYGFRKGERDAHWKYDDNFKLHYDIEKVKALGLVNSFNRVKKDHPWN
jgi:hypothetical protein